MGFGRISKRLAVAALVVFGATSMVGAKATKLTMAPTLKAPTAKGRATLAVKHRGRGAFAIVAGKLAPGKSFDVIVGGVKAGSFTTNPGGSGKLKFSTNPRGTQALLGFDPRGQEVVVREDDGDDDLVGDMPEEEDSATGACCIPGRHEDDEAECEDMAADACTAHGGTPANTSSCLPNPCATTPPGGEIVCCIADSAHGAFDDEDPEVECESTSEAECAHHGGNVVSATSCDPDPCAPTPPAARVACCVADGGKTECELRTPECCTAHGGTASGDTCDPNPCGGGGGGGGGDDGDGSGHH